jgi:hypothetical protein
VDARIVAVTCFGFLLLPHPFESRVDILNLSQFTILTVTRIHLGLVPRILHGFFNRDYPIASTTKVSSRLLQVPSSRSRQIIEVGSFDRKEMRKGVEKNTKTDPWCRWRLLRVEATGIASVDGKHLVFCLWVRL